MGLTYILSPTITRKQRFSEENTLIEVNPTIETTLHLMENHILVYKKYRQKYPVTYISSRNTHCCIRWLCIRWGKPKASRMECFHLYGRLKSNNQLERHSRANRQHQRKKYKPVGFSISYSSQNNVFIFMLYIDENLHRYLSWLTICCNTNCL